MESKYYPIGPREVPLPLNQGVHKVVLDKNEMMANPASTKKMIYGPATVTVIVYPDGGITASVEN